MFLRKEQRGAATQAGPRVPGLVCTESFPGRSGEREGGEESAGSGLCKHKCPVGTGLMRGLVWKRETQL